MVIMAAGRHLKNLKKYTGATIGCPRMWKYFLLMIDIEIVANFGLSISLLLV